ncbi:MAG: hypothetical protein LUD50_05735, partial [Clostridia bacterium]|nr:hypothetical protein [Clostridia bacterium]
AAEQPAADEPPGEEEPAGSTPDEIPAEETAEAEPADEAADEEAADEETEPAADEESEAEAPAAEEDAHKYDYSFLAKVIQAPDETRERYAEIVNSFQSFKGTNTRVSWKQCALLYGRERVGLLLFRGKTLSICLALDPKEFEGTKYRGKNMSERKKYSKTPLMIGVTSGRKLLYSKHLINVMMDRLGASKGGKSAGVSYKYQTTEELLSQGLIKDLTAEAAPDAGAEDGEE